MSEHHSEIDPQLGHGWKLLTMQDADPETLGTLKRLYQDIVSELKTDPGDSAKLADTPGQAALVIVANTILNSDAALNR